jgi:hypothetical protein
MLATTALTTMLRSLFGQSGAKGPSQKLNIAGTGVRSMGFNKLKQRAQENIVAQCDGG